MLFIGVRYANHCCNCLLLNLCTENVELRVKRDGIMNYCEAAFSYISRSDSRKTMEVMESKSAGRELQTIHENCEIIQIYSDQNLCKRIKLPNTEREIFTSCLGFHDQQYSLCVAVPFSLFNRQ